MNIHDFKNEIASINASSWGYGNEILYLMAKTPADLNNKAKLTGAIWLIGRAYAASPQRRSYGTTENREGYINASGKTPKDRPIWPVRTQNDGREGFFDEIAREMLERMEEDATFQGFLENEDLKNAPYAFDRSPADVQKLTDAILAVLKYNLLLSQALEAFDDVPASHLFGGDGVYCSNHISFSSKFLHFFFPQRVFIIDNFARDGGKNLFNGNETDEKKIRGFYDAPTLTSDIFGNDVYKEFKNEDVKRIYQTISTDPAIVAIEALYGARVRSAASTSGDNANVKDYIEHCIRSYLLGVYISQNGIVPIDQITSDPSYSVRSMPRLTDAIFLNVKARITDVMKDHYDSIKRIYGVSYL